MLYDAKNNNLLINKIFWSFIVQLIFFLCLLCSWWIRGIISILEDLQTITVQSNFLALIVTGLYLKWPYLNIWKTNALWIFTATILLGAGFGFWTILFPIYLVDLSTYIINTENINLINNLSIFQLFWNHLVTQIFFIIALKLIFNSSSKWHLYCLSYNRVLKNLLIFIIFITILYYICNWMDIVHPAYGILSNFNPSTKFNSESIKKFNLNILIINMILSSSIFLGLSYYIWYIANKYQIFNLEKQNLHQ